jgi:hypothetical protein
VNSKGRILAFKFGRKEKDCGNPGPKFSSLVDRSKRIVEFIITGLEVLSMLGVDNRLTYIAII